MLTMQLLPYILLCTGRAADYSARRASAPTRQRPVSHSPPYQDLSARQQSVTAVESAARPHSVAVSSNARAQPAAAVAASHRSGPAGARSSSPAAAAAARSPSSMSRAVSMNSGLHARREGSNSPTLQSGGSLVDRVKVTLFGTIRAPGAAAGGHSSSSSSSVSGAAVVARAGEAATRRLSKWVVRQTVMASGVHYAALVWPSSAAAAASTGGGDSPTHEVGIYKTHAEAEQACRYTHSMHSTAQHSAMTCSAALQCHSDAATSILLLISTSVLVQSSVCMQCSAEAPCTHSSSALTMSVSAMPHACTTTVAHICRAFAPPVRQGTEEKCAVCSTGFGLLANRKHHCRNCADAVCPRCSKTAWPASMLPSTYTTDKAERCV
jgi:FYVE zinc finger